jgi:hypothetical protein
VGRRIVTDPQGRRWRVRRRWLVAPVRPRWRGADGGFFDVPDIGVGDADGLLGAIVAVVVIVILAAFVAFYLLPLAILLVEVLIFVVLAAAGIAGRLLLRRPWTLEAEALDGGPKMMWSVAGWRDSRDALDEIATAVERGRPVALSAAASSAAPGSR